MPANYLTYGLIEKYSGIFISDGTLQSDGIRLALEVKGIPMRDREELTEKIIVALQAAVQSSRGK